MGKQCSSQKADDKFDDSGGEACDMDMPSSYSGIMRNELDTVRASKLAMEINAVRKKYANDDA
jgi:hypothetical protein